RIEAYIKEHGLPANSFKRWEKELFDLRGFFESQVKVTSPVSLAARGPAAKSPDGGWEVGLGDQSFTMVGGTTGTDLWVAIGSARNAQERRLVMVARGPV